MYFIWHALLSIAFFSLPALCVGMASHVISRVSKRKPMSYRKKVILRMSAVFVLLAAQLAGTLASLGYVGYYTALYALRMDAAAQPGTQFIKNRLYQWTYDFDDGTRIIDMRGVDAGALEVVPDYSNNFAKGETVRPRVYNAANFNTRWYMYGPEKQIIASSSRRNAQWNETKTAMENRSALEYVPKKLNPVVMGLAKGLAGIFNLEKYDPDYYEDVNIAGAFDLLRDTPMWALKDHSGTIDYDYMVPVLMAPLTGNLDRARQYHQYYYGYGYDEELADLEVEGIDNLNDLLRYYGIESWAEVEDFDALLERFAEEFDLGTYWIPYGGMPDLEYCFLYYQYDDEEAFREENPGTAKTYNFRFTGSYSPVKLAFSEFLIPEENVGLPSTSPDKYYDATALNIRQWAYSAVIFALAAFVLYLLPELVIFSRRDYRMIKMQRNLLLDITHELKTPMGSVMLKGEEVLEASTPEEKDACTEEMIKYIERMRMRLNEVLHSMRLENMQAMLHLETFSMKEAIEDAADQIAAIAEEKGLTVIVPQDRDYQVTADRSYIVRAIFNFLTNAVKYTPAGGRIVVGLRREKGYAVCTVFNNGSYIPAKEIKSIWRQFYKISDGGDNAEKGVGVGLSTVKSIATLHGGGCGCRNNAGGVEFWFRVPVKQKKAKRINP